MRAYIVPPGCTRIEQLQRVERPDPVAAPGQVVVRLRAASLNFRDQAVVLGQYFGGAVTHALIPLSDGAGEVIGVGSDVVSLRPGDRVATTFFQRTGASPLAPPAALGSPLHGVLVEQIALYEDGVVPLPAGYSFEQGACLSCAAVTAWHVLMHAGRPIKPGDTVLALGTGGVSIWALQLARAAGARVIVTSSSDDKLARARTLGASDGINYRTTPDWDQEVLRITAGRGVDCVIEVGGVTTMPKSFNSVARGGKVGMIGVLGGHQGALNPFALAAKGADLYGVFVGTRDMFLELNRAIDANGITPVVDRVFPFDEAIAAYRAHAAGEFVGKVVIAI